MNYPLRDKGGTEAIHAPSIKQDATMSLCDRQNLQNVIPQRSCPFFPLEKTSPIRYASHSTSVSPEIGVLYAT